MKIQTYKLEDKFSKINLDGEEAVWIGDPCYVVPGWDDDVDLWDKLCDEMFVKVTRQHPETGEVYVSRESNFDERNSVRVVDVQCKKGKGGKFYMWSTSYGDGSFPLVHRDNKIAELGVDAGCLSIVPMSLVKKWNKVSSAEQLGHIVTDFKSDMTLRIEDGDMFWSEYSLHTGYESQEDEEEEEHWAGMDNEMYGS